MLGARTPEELEALFEDASVLRDPAALAHLFEARAVLVAGGGLPDAHGCDEIVRVLSTMWEGERTYLADPQRILQVQDAALVLGDRAIHVVRRGDDGSWRYAISLLDIENPAVRRLRRGDR